MSDEDVALCDDCEGVGTVVVQDADGLGCQHARNCADCNALVVNCTRCKGDGYVAKETDE